MIPHYNMTGEVLLRVHKEVKLINGIVIAAALIIMLFLCVNNAYAEGAEPFTGSFECIAYSRVQKIGDAPINTAEHFKKCCSVDYPYSMLKGDLRLTSDGKIIMCHEGGVTLNSKGKIIKYDHSNCVMIRDLTYEQCMDLKFAEKYKGREVSLCGFEQFISICAENGKTAYIAIRNDRIPELMSEMMPILEEYDMVSDCIISSGSLNSLKSAREYAPGIRLAWLLRPGNLDSSSIDTAAGMGNCLITLFAFPTKSFGGINCVSKYSDEIRYAQEKGVDVHVAILEDSAYIDRLKRMGIKGAQINADPKPPVNAACGTLRISSVKNRTAYLVKGRNKKYLVIPPAVSIDGKEYRITTIGQDAFRGSRIRTVVLGKNIRKIKRNAFRRSKAKTLVIKTKKLKKSNVKGAFRSSSLKQCWIKTGSKKTNRVFAARYTRILAPRITGWHLKIRY